MSISWKDSYSVGVKEIDEQHKLFVDVLQKMTEALVSGSTHEHRGELVVSLEQYVDMHFNTEENYFKKFAYEGAAEHIIEHNKFRLKAAEEIGKIKAGADFSYELINYLESWLANHIMDMDMKYAACFQEHGLT